LIQKGDINRTGLLAAVARMVAPRQEVPTPLPSRPRRPARPGRPVVLVVEDNPDSLRTAKALLNECYQVIEATDGQAGVEQARRHQPDLILMDIALPVMDGVQALQEIRKDATLRHIPVIALTASAMVGERETILAHGFDGYISKPIDAELLETTLREALD
jgi:CheY-like chemotaxis protein